MILNKEGRERLIGDAGAIGPTCLTFLQCVFLSQKAKHLDKGVSERLIGELEVQSGLEEEMLAHRIPTSDTQTGLPCHARHLRA